MQKIELNDQDAEKFLKFIEHYDTFSVLLDRGVFNVKNGSVVMDFDKNGTMQTIRFTGFMYSKRHEDKKYIEPTAYISI